MKKKFLIGAAACAAGILCSGAAFSLADFSGYAAENGETNVAEWFSIENGASVKVDSETRGMRFATYVSKEKFDELEAQGKNPVFGTLFMAESDLAGEKLTLETANAANVTAEKWVNNRNSADENGNYMYMSALINLPEEYYSSNICARSYVTIDGETSYTETVSRSYSGVALAAYADTSAKYGEEMKSTLYNSYLNGKKFADLDANSISYDAKKTSLTVSDGGKINVSEKGEDRAWNNVFFKFDQQFEKGKTYYFSFDLENVVAQNCDLFLGVRGTDDARKLTIDGFTADAYKKVSEGAITFTYTAEDNFEYMRFFLFSNFATAGDAYSYSYSVDNFAVQDWVNAGTLGGKFSNPVAYGAKFKGSVSNPEIFENNYAGTAYLESGAGKCGMYFQVRNVNNAPGNYRFTFTVNNISDADITIYAEYWFLINAETYHGVKDWYGTGLVKAGEKKQFTYEFTFDGSENDKALQLAVFTQNVAGSIIEIGDVSVDFTAAEA